MNKKWGSKARSEIYGDLWSVFVVCNLRFTSKFGRIRGRSGPQTVTAPGQPLNCVKEIAQFSSVKAVCWRTIIRFFCSLCPSQLGDRSLTILDGCEARERFPLQFGVVRHANVWANFFNPVETWDLCQSEIHLNLRPGDLKSISIRDQDQKRI